MLKVNDEYSRIRIQDPDPGSGSGSISQKHGSEDPDPHQNVMDPENCFSEGRYRSVDMLYNCEYFNSWTRCRARCGEAARRCGNDSSTFPRTGSPSSTPITRKFKSGASLCPPSQVKRPFIIIFFVCRCRDLMILMRATSVTKGHWKWWALKIETFFGPRNGNERFRIMGKFDLYMVSPRRVDPYSFDPDLNPDPAF